MRAFVAGQLQKPDYRLVSEPAPPLSRAWQVSLADGERLLTPQDGRASHDRHDLFFSHGAELSCRDAATGKPRWQRKLTQAPAWVGQHADVVVVASLEGVHGLSLADGDVLWSFLVVPRSGDGLGQGTATALPEALSGFHLAASRLFFLQGERRLFTLDVESGRVVWARWAPGAQVEPLLPAGRFHALYHADEDWVVVQTTAGKLLVLDSRSGRLLHETITSEHCWPRSPRAIERLVCLVTDPRHIVLFDPAAGKEVWTHQTSTPSISTAAPQILSDGKVLLALIDGWQLEGLDPLTGVPRWQRAISTEPVDLGAAALDQTALYFVSRGVLHARALSDGRSLWRLPLDHSPHPWRVLHAHGSVVVFPVQAERAWRRPWLAGGYLVAFPWEIEWRDLPVLICDPEKGCVVQRLHVPAAGPEVAAQLVDRGVVLALPGNAVGLRTGD